MELECNMSTITAHGNQYWHCVFFGRVSCEVMYVVECMSYS
jgi:hypothetical protein